MALVLEAEQNSLIAQAGLTIITLVKLTTYADTLSKSVPVRHYFSDKPVIYDYDNLGTDREFWPVVASFSDFTRSFQHVPSADDMRPYRDSLRVNFSNQEFQGRRLINLLRDENLLGADIELSEIAVPSMDSYPVDLTAKTGTEHTVHFAGYIRTVDDVSQSVFTLSCEVRMPSNDLIWGLSRLAAGAAASAARPARRYKNVRLPIGYGYDAGWESVMVHGGGEGRLNGDI
ncbi:MAG: hypothetical protein KAJ19_09525, partial [Gammaproteobacteria bacterium]|nr:hypothetical protein [Gammaproteobacteria bacterium]